MLTKSWPLDTVERAVRTGAQVLAGYLSAAQLINQIDWTAALSATGFAIVLSLITSAIGSPSWGTSLGFQVAERATKTFLQAILTGIGAAVVFEQVDWKTALSAAALAAAYSVVNSVITTRVGAAGTVGQVNVTAPPAPVAAAA